MNHHTLLLLLAGLCAGHGATAQKIGGPAQLIELLTGGGDREWIVLSADNTLGNCGEGSRGFTFHQSSAQVDERACRGSEWVVRTHPYTLSQEGDEARIAFMGQVFQANRLQPGAPVCGGRKQCIRLSSLPDGKTDATMDLYLTR